MKFDLSPYSCKCSVLAVSSTSGSLNSKQKLPVFLIVDPDQISKTPKLKILSHLSHPRPNIPLSKLSHFQPILSILGPLKLSH